MNMTLDLKSVFASLAAGDTDPLLSLVEQRKAEFKLLSYEEKYQTLLRLAVALGDHGMTGDVETFDKITMTFVNRGFSSYFNEDEFALAKETLEKEGMENPSEADVILRLRTNYRGEAPPADEPIKLSLLYDHFRTQGWNVKPEDALVFIELSKNDNEIWGGHIDKAIMQQFGKPSLTRA